MSEDEKRSNSRSRKSAEPEEATETPQEEAVDVLALKAELEKLRKELAERDAVESTEAPKTGKFVIHFVADGLTMLGKLWRRGQELEFDTNTQAYRDTCDVTGFSVLELRRNPQAQEERWGKVYFREGPWTGKTFADLKYEAIKKLANQNDEEAAVSIKELAELEKFDKQRRSTPQPLAPLTGAMPRSN